MVSVVQVSPGDITGIADIIKPLLGQLQRCTVFQWCRKWVRCVVLLFWVLCKAPSIHMGWRLKVCSFSPQMRTVPLPNLRCCQVPSLQGTSSVKLQEQSTVKHHFTEPVAHLQPAHPRLVVWTSFMFPCGALEPEISSTGDFLYRKILVWSYTPVVRWM